MEGFPILSTECDSIENQIKFLNELPLQPDFLINLKVKKVHSTLSQTNIIIRYIKAIFCSGR